MKFEPCAVIPGATAHWLLPMCAF